MPGSPIERETMIKHSTVLSVLAVALLAACSKSPDSPAAAGQAEGQPAQASTPRPPQTREAKAQGLMALIDTAPQCQEYRQQLEEAGKVPADAAGAVDLNTIVAAAHAAGCSKKP